VRTFNGNEGVLGALGVYRAALMTMTQTEELAATRVRVPVIGVGGSLSRGDAVARWLAELCDHVVTSVIEGGHFLPEEQPAQIKDLVLRHAAKPGSDTHRARLPRS